ncbi:probable protein phosphatase CG10417 [Oppia nitens]|uniref:probable protein phosphatase CG10417 n=1 Tax=Oppia nitens TaxID=1686743 RepID=UPI0023DB12B0|nr:probable protein phosphatase CG10417 [Oppia nitens]
MFHSNRIFSQSLQNAYNNNRIEEMLSKIYLKSAITQPELATGAGNCLTYGLCSVQGWRRYQEDAHVAALDFDDQWSLFAVFDGHNGPEVALLARQRLPQMLRDNKCFIAGEIDRSLEQVFMAFDALLLTRTAHNQLFELRRSALGNENMSPNDKPGVSSGCTALVVLINRETDTVYVANIGDSRCVLSRSGKVTPMSTDHKPEDRPERKRIERAGGHIIDGRINGGLNLSRAFGDHQYKRNRLLLAEEQMVTSWPEIKVKQFKPKSGDFLVIACDGIWNTLSTNKVAKFVDKRLKSGRHQLTDICQQLTYRCMSPVLPIHGIGGDNMTCIIVRFDGQPSSSPSPSVSLSLSSMDR